MQTKGAQWFAAAVLLMSLSNASAFSPRPQSARVAPISAQQADSAQRAMPANRPDYNIYKTLAHHVDLYERWSPLGQFLLNGSTLPARDREILMLRMGWLCQSEYEWSQHARIAKAQAGMSDAEIERIAVGATAAGWTDFERTLLKAVDELRYEAMLSDDTWHALHGKYSTQQVMEALFTAAQYQLVSMALNTLGVQLDPELKHRLPKLPAPSPASVPTAPRLSTPRVAPIALDRMTEDQRVLVAEQIRDGRLPNLYGTMAHHPKLYTPRLRFGQFIQRQSRLPVDVRELLILRTAWLIQAEYEWSHHVPIALANGLTQADVMRVIEGPQAEGWNARHKAVIQAADDLRREAFVTDATWQALARHFDTKELIEIVYTVGGYTMTGLALNTFGVQIEMGYDGWPQQ